MSGTIQFASCSSSKDLTTETTLGLGGYFRVGYWTPIKISVENKGASFSGYAELVVAQGSRLMEEKQMVIYKRRLFLPEYSRTEFWVNTHMGSSPRPLRLRILNAGEKIISDSEISVRHSMTIAPLTVVLGTQAGYEQLVGAGPGVVSKKVAYIENSDFPGAWLALEGVSHIIVHGIDNLDLTAAQLSALTQWVDTGGHLVVADIDGSKPALAAASALLPVFPAGSIAPMPGKAPQGLKYPTGAYGSLSVRKPRAVSPWEGLDDTRLGTSWAFGAGRVTYLPWDPLSRAFGSWNYQRYLWTELYPVRTGSDIVGSKQLAMIASNDDDDGYGRYPRSLSPGMAHIYASKWTVLLLCVIYILGLKAAARFNDISDNGVNPFWPIALTGAVLFSGVGFLNIGLPALKKNTGINEISFLMGRPDSHYLQDISYISGFSPRAGRFTMTFRNDTQGLIQLSKYGRMNPNAEYSLEDTYSTITLPLTRWSGFELSSSSVCPIPVRLTRTGRGKYCKVANTTSQTIYDAYVLAGDRPISIGNIEPFGKRTITLQRGTYKDNSINPFIDSAFLVAQDYLSNEERNNRINALDAIVDEDPPKGPTFLGWLRKPIWEFVKYGGLPVRSSVSMILVPFTPPKPDEEEAEE